MKKILDYLKAFVFVWVPAIILALVMSYCNNERCPDDDCDGDGLPEGYSWKGDLKKDSTILSLSSADTLFSCGDPRLFIIEGVAYHVEKNKLISNIDGSIYSTVAEYEQRLGK